MFSRVPGAIAILAAATVLPACSGPSTRAQAPLDPEPAAPTEPEWVQDADADEPPAIDMLPNVDEPVVRVAPPSWTGAFSETAVILGSTVRIEGPAGLRDHLVASSDDVYERSLETTQEGLVQIIRRTSDETREIRVQIDAWSLAAYDRVLIVERPDDGPVRIIASGEAIWRDMNGHLLQGNRLEFTGEIGDDTPFAAPPADGSDAANSDTHDNHTHDNHDTWDLGGSGSTPSAGSEGPAAGDSSSND